ncbi:MAG: TetR/AcrR family transcriptional regulator [Alphaproteobacteria bacterium]
MPPHGVTAQVKDEALVRERRAQIVHAAKRVFREKSFHEATVRDVGVAAGLTQGTLYNYVRTKEDILYLVCADLTRTYVEDTKAAIAGITDPRERLRLAVRTLFESMDRHQDDVRLLYHESHQLSRPALRAVLGEVATFVALFEQIIEDARAAGLVVAGSKPVAADVITYLPTILALRGWRMRRVVDQRQAIEELVAFTLRGLGIMETDAPAV